LRFRLKKKFLDKKWLKCLIDQQHLILLIIALRQPMTYLFFSKNNHPTYTYSVQIRSHDPKAATLPLDRAAKAKLRHFLVYLHI
jgi:hypothetical protein